MTRIILADDHPMIQAAVEAMLRGSDYQLAAKASTGAEALQAIQETEADIIVLDATSLNVAPLNHVPGTVVSLMDRTNVETVIVAGKIRKWKGQLLDVNLNNLRSQLEASRDFIFNAAGVPQSLFDPH